MRILRTVTTLWMLGAVAAVSIWPIPESVEEGDGVVWMQRDVILELNLPKNSGSNEPDYVNPSVSGSKIEAAWKRNKVFLFKQNIVPWKFHPKGTDFEPKFSPSGAIKKVVVTQRKTDRSRVPVEELNEEYTLSMPDASGKFFDSNDNKQEPGTIYIDAETSNGALHGLTTLSQLFYRAEKPEAFENIYSPSTPVLIKDKPKFKHRGLNLDVARQWYPLKDIKRLIDTLSWNKFNRLHFHATDSQSWPLEIPSLPDLANKGKYGPHMSYTPEDLQNLLTYASKRGIEIIVEIDMPGHTASIADAYPDLITGRNMQPDWDTYAAQPPSGSLKLNNPSVETFVTQLFSDLLPRLHHHSRYFHHGGDEVNRNVYLLDPGVNSNSTDTIRPHLQRFMTHLQSQLTTHSAIPITWEEILLDWNLTLARNTIIQTWQSDSAVSAATSKGHRVIAGNYNYWYLDCGHGQWLDFRPGESYDKYYPFADYCSPRKSWKLMYAYDPLQGLETEEQKRLVLGGEAHVWSEQIDGASLDAVVWPRAGAAGEVLWSGRKDAEGRNRTLEAASERLGVWRERLLERGVGAAPVMQLWCYMNKGGCQL
ncbi:hypothetical protein EX30DRAFT_365830 [Ascodesmis nigricans]|uniref:Beta-hexosaminidase n=1 Tax=Ascodesmis nigricans TaxID=341454 RepID=A0A4S2MNS2_9PEZI|nr:hypothetical protein EX30DRAFT_365830 [Ascodesmis nigricans]